MAETHFSGRLAGYELTPGYQSGIYYSCPASNISTGAPAANALRCLPFLVTQDTRFDQIAFELTGLGGDVTWNTRVGVYAADENAGVGALLLDAGQIGTGSGAVANAKTISISLFLMTGLYWLACLSQGTTGPPTLRCCNILDVVNLPVPVANPQIMPSGLEMTGITGALPLFGPAVQTPVNPAPRIFLRAA